MNILTKYVILPVTAVALTTGAYFAFRDSPAEKLRAAEQAECLKRSTIDSKIGEDFYETTVKMPHFWRNPSIKLKVTRKDGSVFEATDYKADGTVEEFHTVTKDGKELSNNDFYASNVQGQLDKVTGLYAKGMETVRAENARIEANRIANLDAFVTKYSK